MQLTNLGTARLADATVTPGQRVRNLVTGETMTFLRTSAGSGGESIELELELRPTGAPGGAPHRHIPAERLELSSGAVCVWIAPGRPWLARAGDVIEVPPRRWHFLVAIARTRARVSIRPAMRFDELLVALAAIGSGDLRADAVRRVVPLLREHGCI
jgi:mannose-6-phosphate isomerase-like protein (cupin superfamily)